MPLKNLPPPTSLPPSPGWFSRAKSLWAPPARLTVSEWADTYRQLSAEAAAEPGRWRTSRAEYQRGIMDAVSDQSIPTVVVKSSAQVGKALAIDTPIPTANGWKAMGDLEVGDSLFDESGKQCQVTFATEHMHDRNCYRIAFSDGSTIVADEDHKWVVDTATKQSVVMTTGEMLPGYKTGKRNNYAIPVARPLETASSDLPIDPYVLGLWLGDGHSLSARITCHADDTDHYINHITDAGFRTRVQPDKTAKTIRIDPKDRTICPYGHDKNITGWNRHGCAECSRRSASNYQRGKYGRDLIPAPNKVKTFPHLLDITGLLGSKHIPYDYLRGDISQRFALLQGLMDTDGYICAKKGRSEFVTTCSEIADGFGELLHSLGIKHTRAIRQPTTTYKGRKVHGALAYRFSFMVYKDKPIFRIPRKLERMVSSKGRRHTEVMRRRITSIERVPSVPVRCIQVNSTNHLFLAGESMIPTHNTEIVLNIAGYFMHQDPAPMLCVLPTLELAQSFAKDRLAAMCRDTPVLAGKLKARGGARSANPDTRTGSTLLHKTFEGGHITLTGSNSSVGLSSRPCRIVLCDEVDRFPLSSNEEGDPVNLARKRSTTFWNRKTILTSTPTVLGVSRIDAEWEESDKRLFFVSCPHCSHSQSLHWDKVVWPKDRPAEAKYACSDCGVLWTDAERWAAISQGEWHPTAEHTGVAGFHLSEIYSPWSRLGEMAHGFVVAKRGGAEMLQTWVNTSLGECWDPEEGEGIDPSSMLSRREDYTAQVPDPAQVLVAGVDVQDDRIEYEIVGYAAGEESWGISYRRLYGDPGGQELWTQLTQELRSSWAKGDGTLLEVRLVCIDSGGHYTDEVYKWCRNNGTRWAIPIKGASEYGKPVCRFPRKINKDHRVYLTTVGTDTAKELIYGRFTLTEPGFGYCHFPRSEEYDETWFQQATAEKKVRKYKKGVAYFIWDAGRRRNEALDCRVYGLAAIRILQQHMGVRLKPREPKEEPDISVDEEIAQTDGEPRPPGKRKRRRKQSSSWVNYEGKWM